jgi:cytidine deaminase
MPVLPPLRAGAPQPDPPAAAPTDMRTDMPTDTPTDTPTNAPTDVPTDVPTDAQMAQLIAAARAAREQAYAPYSNFAVGAALLDEHGRIHAGCNIENAAYPQGQCAEASAIAHLVLAGGRRILAAAVVGVADDPVTPCGGCRQRLREFAADDAAIWAADLHAVRGRFTLGALLPASFGPGHLMARTARTARTAQTAQTARTAQTGRTGPPSPPDPATPPAAPPATPTLRPP